jgi:hypothetical protein
MIAAPNRGRHWGAGLAYYRLYILSGPDGRFVGFEEIEANDDVEAARAAEAHVGAQPLELWCGKRKVKSFAPVEAPTKRKGSRAPES